METSHFRRAFASVKLFGMRIGVADYGVGTWTSVVNLCESIGIEAISCTNPKDLDELSHLILPGVGNYGRAMGLLDSGGWRDAITSFANSGKPTLGICLGMQLLGNVSEEAQGNGLQLMEFEVSRLPSEGGYRVPHMGWNSVEQVWDHPIFQGWNDDYRFYFVHSFAIAGTIPESVGTTSHGAVFTSMVAKENIVGVQFHPEKSRRYGMKLLENFSRM
jgi:imidazole glycerol-phosphate synthase subunit HisH